MNTVYIALGSNIGDRKAHIATAIEQLNTVGTVKSTSSLYETEPVGYTNQADFINAVVCVHTELSPNALIEATRKIEVEQGRVRDPQNQFGPRIIDIDILFYNDFIIDTSQLHIPHPRMHERNFVLLPLVEIAPSLMHPVLHKTIEELYIGLKNRSQVQKLD